ncbi:MAG: helix-turn-helix transcriptional regulator [Deltaproteobacteria bacterium]|nr:helix-turn-helix transcriptional regulator [Deltaproteobacteria bacterium]
MRPAADLDAFFAEPIGRYASCGSCFYFWADPKNGVHLSGTVAWGRPSEADVKKLVHLYEVELTSVAPVHLSYVDLSRVEAIAPAAFAVMSAYFAKYTPKLKGLISKQALIRPPGIAGAVVAGFYELVAAAYPVKIFADRKDAFDWLGYADGDALRGELERLHGAGLGLGATTRLLRDHLDANVRDASIATAAKALSVSERTLQRRLRDEGTAFQAELNAAQVRAAKRLLVETDLKVTAIALEIGCASLQHFSDLFRKLEGLPPSTYRERGRHHG